MSKINRIHDFKKRLDPIIDTLKLDDTERYIIKKRFVHEVVHYDRKADKCKKTYNSFRFLVTSGSLLIPALLSIQKIGGTSEQFKNNIYWTTWALSLAVTTCNGFVQLFSLDKNYFTYSIITEKLKTEGWQFLQLSGKYDEYITHNEAFKPFCNNIETLKIKQVMSEFTSGGKVSKTNNKGQNANNAIQKDMENNLNNEFSRNFQNNLNNNLNNNQNNQNNNQNNQNNNLNNNFVSNMMDNVVSNVSNISSKIVDKIVDNKIDDINNTIDSTLTQGDKNIHLKEVRKILSPEQEQEQEQKRKP